MRARENDEQTDPSKTQGDKRRPSIGRKNARILMTTEVLRTFWSLDPFECVLVANGDRYTVQVFTRTEALLVESTRTLEQAQKTANRLLKILAPVAHHPSTSPPSGKENN